VNPITDAEPFRVLLVDDQELVRSGLKRILRPRDGLHVVAECAGARAAVTAITAGGDVAARYRSERRRAFAAKTALSWLVQGFLAVPPLLEHAIARLEARPSAALRLGSALGDCRPATDALSPRAMLEVLAP